MKVRITVRPTGYFSADSGPLRAWPKVGEVVDLPEIVARDLIASDRAEEVGVLSALRGGVSDGTAR